LTRTYLLAVARSLSCVVWVGEGQDVEMAKLRVAEASAPWRSNSPDGITLGSGSEYSGRSWRWRCPWGPLVASPHPSAVASPLASCHLSSRRLPRPQSAASAASGPMAPPHQPPASEWCCCHTPRSSPLTSPIQSPHRRAAGMNQDGEHRVPRVQPADRRYRALHTRPMVHLLPYPRPRRQGRAVLRSHIGSGSVPGARGKQPKPRQITG
jgi:hypothetical protein